MTVPETLKALRKSRKLIQDEVAAILNIKRSRYASYETGRVEIDLDLLQKLANHYSVTTDAILKGYAIGQKEMKEFKVSRPTSDEFMDVTVTEMAMIKATIKNLREEVVNLKKRITKKPYDESISRDLQKSIKEDYNHILDELRNKKGV